MRGFVFRLIHPRSDFAFAMNDEARPTMTAHFGYWSKLAEEGKALAFGPVDDPGGNYGMGIVVAEDDREVSALRDRDPDILSSHRFRTEIAPMLSLVTPTLRLDG